MQTTTQISLARKILYGITLIVVFVATFGSGSLSTVKAQESNPGVPALQGTPTLVARDATTEVETESESYVPGQLIVKFIPAIVVSKNLSTTSSSEVNDLMAQVGVTSIEPMIKWPNGEKPSDFPEIDSYYVMNLSSGSDIQDAQRILANNNDIEFTIPNYVGYITDGGNSTLSSYQSKLEDFPNNLSQDPNDNYYTNQWPLHDDHLKFRSAWNITTGSPNIVIAVLDTGLDVNHPDIGGKNTGTGYNFLKNSSDISDVKGHGTNVAGLIAAYGNNSIGITGISWNSKIMPVKVCDDQGKCDFIAVINGMLWAANHGANIINMSFRFNGLVGSPYSDPATHVQAFFDYIYNKKVIAIASAGNNNENLVVPSDGSPASIIFPAAFNHVIAVGAVNRNDQRCNFNISVCGWDTASGWGERLDLVAPGSTDYPSTDVLGAAGLGPGDYYLNMGGTSGAAPHVAGLAALILSVNSQLDPDQVEYYIEHYAVDLGIQGKDVSFGWGRIDAFASINAVSASSDNTPPTGSWTSPSNGQTISSRSVQLSVNASDNSGGSGVKEVRFSAKWGGTWRGIGTVSNSPYSLSWDMCSSGVPNGDVELGFEVWDNASNKWVYSEHYTNYHINKNYSCSQSPDTTPPTGNWTSPGNGQTISSQSVTLSVNASDNSGGSGVREVRWSAKWNNTWYGVGSDTTAPYSTNWDMCAVNVPNGDIELGMEVWDNANNVWIYSQHYTNYHINKSYTCSGNSSGSWETWGWQNKYLAGYDNWHGTLTWTNYPYIWWGFGSGGPFGWGGDEFSLRMQRDVYFPGGDYSFHVDHDDGARVYLDGQLIIDAWWDGNGGHDAGRNISQGNHQVKVEYYENQGDALIHVLWYGPGYPRPDDNPPDGSITSPDNFSATSYSPLTITADASDDVSGVNRVEFYVWYCDSSCSWRLISTDYDSPYSASWDWSALSDQHVYLTIHIVDNTGKVREDPGGYVEVDLDRTSPTVSISYPMDGETLNGSPITISVDASDSLSGVSGVQFFMGYNEADGLGRSSDNPLPPPATVISNGLLLSKDLSKSAEYWHEVGWDDNGSDGWSMIWDPASVPDQTGIDAFVYTYDKAGNYQGAIRVDISLFRPPSNDDFDTPIQLSTIPYTNQQYTISATSTTDDPAFTSCNRAPGTASVWYKYVPSQAGTLVVDTIGSSFDTVLGIWKGTRGNLTSMGCNDDVDGSLQSRVVAKLAANTIYYIEAAKFSGYSSLSNMEDIKPELFLSTQDSGNLKMYARWTASKTYRSTGAIDGHILESTETSNKGGTLNSDATTFNLGDDATDKQYRAILSFYTGGLPDTAIIVKVTLKIKNQGLVGTNPFNILGGLKMDIRKPFFGSSSSMVISDFQAEANKVAVATFNRTPITSWYSTILGSAGYPYINLTGTTQFRLRFTKDDNDDKGADYLKFFSGNASTTSYRPQLIIEYYLP